MCKLAELPYDIYQHIPRHADFHVVKTELNIRKLEDVIRTILREYCDVNVMGYNSTENYYWCKIEYKKSCLLYTEIKLYANDYESSSIIIINESEANLRFKGINCKKQKANFINNITEAIYLYQNSSFTQHYVETCCC